LHAMQALYQLSYTPRFASFLIHSTQPLNSIKPQIIA
jgi:hypothetical protein